MSVNKAILIGRVGKDPEGTTLPSGATVAKFSLATSQKFKDKSGEKREETQWHNIVMFGTVADVVKRYVHKGDEIYLEGKITTRSWEKDGTKHYMTEIVCHTMQMLGGKGNGSKTQQTRSEPDLRSEFDMMLDNESDDIAF